jgi:hypothetical protein
VRIFNTLAAVAALTIGGADSSAGPVAAPTNYMELREPARLALVVANSEYANLAPLPSALLDAQKMKVQLEALGFSVTSVTKFESVEHFEDEVLPAFRSKISAGDIVVFYFSGHGFSYGPNNFLAPANLPKSVPTRELTIAAVAVESLEDYFGKRSPGVMLFVLDACRSIAGFVVKDETAEGYISKGLIAPTQPPDAANVMYAFASRPGSPALTRSEPGEMSIFTGSLSEHIVTQYLEFGSVFRNVSAQVAVKTQGDQHPGIANWSDTDLYFSPPDFLRSQHELVWKAALSSQNRTEIATFLRRFSVSPFADAARRWLKDHPAPELFAHSTAVSPWAVERAWQPGGRRFALASAPAGIAFSSSVTADYRLFNLSSFPDQYLGMVPSTDIIVGTGIPMLRWSPDALAAHRDIVTTQSFVARYLPSNQASSYATFEAGTSLEINRIEYSPSGDAWLAVNTRDRSPRVHDVDASSYYIAMSDLFTSQSVDLGIPLTQIEVRPADDSLPELLAAEPIALAIADLKRAGKQVTWVAVATAPVAPGPDQRRDELVRALRVTHASYLLREAGIDGKTITSTAGVPGIPDEAVRVRFFGN